MTTEPTAARRLPVHGDCPYGHTTQQHHTLDGLEAELRDEMRINAELRAERDSLRRQLDDMTATAAGFADERDEARAELGRAQDYIAAIAHPDEQRDRARAAYDTRQERTADTARPSGHDGDYLAALVRVAQVPCHSQAADLGSPAARAQDQETQP